MEITLYQTKPYLRSVSLLPKGVDIKQVEEEIAKNPLHWPIIPGTGGVRKARFGIGNKGKSGGGRLCYLYLMQEEDIYLLAVYSKNVQEDLNPDQKNALKQTVKQIKETR